MHDHLVAAARSAGVKFNARRLAHERMLNGRVEPKRAAPRIKVSPTELAKIVDKVRKADEFKRPPRLSAPIKAIGPFTWSLEAIRNARDMQMRGNFHLPVRLAEAMRTDDALFVAYHNRISPQSAVQTKLVACGSTRGARVAAKAASSVHIARSVLEGVAGTLANHGIAIGYIEQETNEEGTCTDFRLTEWPLEHVQWDPSREELWTRTKEDPRVTIAHGNGQWVIFRKFSVLPWTQEACILPGAFIWAAHANGIKDWALASTSHGQAKIVGTLPEGTSLQDADALTPEAQGFLNLLQDLISGEGGAGIAPFGAEVDFLANGSTAWQVFSELILNREKAAARIYLGTDAMMGAAGGAPGVDISALFGVATTKIQGDFEAIEQALYTGVYQPWTAINEGDSRYAPRLVYQLPDPDAKAKSEERAAARDRLMTALKAMRDQQMVVDQSVVDTLATEFGVFPIPQLATQGASVVPLVLAPTDASAVIRGREARAAQGLPPFGDYRDDMTIPEIKADADQRAKAKAQIAIDAADPSKTSASAAA